MPYKTSKKMDIVIKGGVEDSSLASVCKKVGPKVRHWLLSNQADYSVEYLNGDAIIHINRHAGAEKASKKKAQKEYLEYKNEQSKPAKNVFKVHLDKQDYDISVFLNSLSDPEPAIKEALRNYLDSHK